MADGISESDKAELRRIRKKLDGIRGPGVVHSKESVYIGPTPTPRPQKVRQNNDEVWVRVDGEEAQDGAYSGFLLDMTLTDAADPATIAPGTVGTETDAVLILNKGPEIGTSGHSLTETPVNATDWPGRVVGVTNEDPPRLVVVINAIDIGACA